MITLLTGLTVGFAVVSAALLVLLFKVLHSTARYISAVNTMVEQQTEISKQFALQTAAFWKLTQRVVEDKETKEWTN